MCSANQDKLDSLSRRIRRCVRCRLSVNRTRAVPGEGPAGAKIVFVGKAPGDAEDRQGRPFCGRAGRFLDGLFAEVGFRREDAFITSSVKCRPPGNRAPRKDELDTCREWLEQQVDAIQPGVVVLFGRTPLRQALGSKERLADVHGSTGRWRGRPVFLTYHPAAAMRFPLAAKSMREDFAALRRIVDEGGE